MKWFRSHIKQGSKLALLALAIQFALSFGHFHGTPAQAASAVQSVPVQVDLLIADDGASPEAVADASQQPSPPNHDSDQQQPIDPCAICAVMSLASSVLFTTPPLLLLPHSVEFLYQITDAEFVHLNAVRVDFQPRAPPLS